MFVADIKIYLLKNICYLTNVTNFIAETAVVILILHVRNIVNVSMHCFFSYIALSKVTVL
jgi:hypothetical protein